MSAAVVFVHGRPAPHPFHAALARSVGADFLPVDFLLRWHDRAASRPRRYLSWLLCALLLPRRRQYDVFLTEGVHFLPLILRRLRLLRPRQRTMALLSNETLYFLQAGRYPEATRRALLLALRAYDALICIGRMETDLARTLLTGTSPGPRLVTARSGVASDRLESLTRITPSLDGRQLLFVGHGPSGWRGWYKGLDLLLHATTLATPGAGGLRLAVVGDWDATYVDNLLATLPQPPATVEFLGRQSDLSDVLAAAALYVHLGRGEAFGISVLEAMVAGVPALVSEWTGAREVVEHVDRRLVVPLDAQAAAERIRWYLALPRGQKEVLSARSREVAAGYTEARAIAEFAQSFRHLLATFTLRDLAGGERPAPPVERTGS